MSDPREYNRLCTHISQGQLHIDKFLEKRIYETGVINPHLPISQQSGQELFSSLADDLQAMFTIAVMVYSYRGGIIKRYKDHGYDVTSPLSNEVVADAKSVIASLQ